jgi:dTDP-glucose 4,6-dehydratase
MTRFLRYSSDLVIWFWTILFKGEACHPYNVGSDQEITIAQLAESVASTLGGAALFSSVPNINSFPSRYVPSTARARKQLGLTEWTDREEAIRKTADWWQSPQ